MKPTTRSTVAFAWASVLFCSTAGLAQVTTVKPGPSAADSGHTQTQSPFFTTGDALMAGSFAVATIVMFPLDKQFAEGLQNQSKNNWIKHASTGVEVIASPGAYFIGGSLYALGRLGGFQRVADLGLHGSEAVLLADATTFMIKGLAGRGRPFLSNGEDPNDFDLGQGFGNGDLASFPSGHTTTAFAAAAAVTTETSRWWPKSTWIVGPLMYGGATAVGLSRMYHNRHWASDVVVGAAIGTFSGRKITQYAHGHPGNRIDRIMLRTSVTPDGHGAVRVGVTLPMK